jgi:hypothetical protein
MAHTILFATLLLFMLRGIPPPSSCAVEKRRGPTPRGIALAVHACGCGPGTGRRPAYSVNRKASYECRPCNLRSRPGGRLPFECRVTGVPARRRLPLRSRASSMRRARSSDMGWGSSVPTWRSTPDAEIPAVIHYQRVPRQDKPRARGAGALKRKIACDEIAGMRDARGPATAGPLKSESSSLQYVSATWYMRTAHPPSGPYWRLGPLSSVSRASGKWSPAGVPLYQATSLA